MRAGRLCHRLRRDRSDCCSPRSRRPRRTYQASRRSASSRDRRRSRRAARHLPEDPRKGSPGSAKRPEPSRSPGGWAAGLRALQAWVPAPGSVSWQESARASAMTAKASRAWETTEWGKPASCSVPGSGSPAKGLVRKPEGWPSAFRCRPHRGSAGCRWRWHRRPSR